jgi:hypothetical protein
MTSRYSCLGRRRSSMAISLRVRALCNLCACALRHARSRLLALAPSCLLQARASGRRRKIRRSLRVAPSDLQSTAGNTNGPRSSPFEPALPQGRGSPSLRVKHQLCDSYASIAAGSPIEWSCHCYVFPGLGSPWASIVCPSSGPIQDSFSPSGSFLEI